MNINEQFQKALEDARAVAAVAEKENRDFTADERTQVETLLKSAKGYKEQLQKQREDAQLRQQLDDMGAFADRQTHNGKSRQARGTLGEQFVNSEAWQGYIKGLAVGGTVPDSRKGIASPAVPVADFGMFRRKAAPIMGSDPTGAGAFMVPEQSNLVEMMGYNPLSVRDLIDVRQTTSDTVEFVRQTSQVTNAAVVPEANVVEYTGATGQVSGEKPLGTMTFERITESVKTIAVWVATTKRALSDAAQLRGLIDSELREAQEQELEDQILNGSGVGDNFAGLANTSGVLQQSFVTDIVATTRKAITYLLVTGKQQPTAWLMHPEDWEQFDLTKDGQGRYYWGGPSMMGMRTLWGIPVVQSFKLTPGTAYLGNWRKAVLWDRQQSTIFISDSHADFFIRNMVAVLGEMRAAFGIIRPSGFVEVSLDSGS